MLLRQLKKGLNKLRIGANYFIGYFIIIPLATIIPKKNSILLIPRYGDFEGNLKYLYLYLSNIEQSEIEIIILTRKKEVYKQLKESGYNIWLFPGLKTVIGMLRSKLIVVDSNGWHYNFFYYYLYRAKKIQVWHGTGIKSILQLRSGYDAKSRLKKMLSKQNIYYDIVSFSSQYQLETRGKAFRFGKSLINGLPRNDIFFNNKLWADVCSNHYLIKRLLQHKKEETSIVTYAPTWRYGLNRFEQIDLADFNAFAAKNNFILIIKLHVKANYDLKLTEYSNIISLNKHDDIYPLLAITDLLVTDYSSIYFDYLLTDKPVVFYPYDRDDYINNQKELLVDYDLVTPGPKCYSQPELESEIYRFLIHGNNLYKESRKAIRDKYFCYQDGYSSQRLWECIKQIL